MKTTPALYGDELLNAIFAHFSEQRFRITESRLVAVLYRALSKPEYKQFQQNYPFDTDGMEPRSKALSDAFDSLQQSRLVGRMNPDLVQYDITPAVKVRYDRFIRPKIATREKKLRQLAAEVESGLKQAAV